MLGGLSPTVSGWWVRSTGTRPDLSGGCPSGGRYPRHQASRADRLSAPSGPTMWAKKGNIMIAKSTRRSIARISTRLTSDDRGMTTAEYAVGTVAAVGLGGVLLKLLTSSQVGELIWSIIRAALSAFL